MNQATCEAQLMELTNTKAVSRKKKLCFLKNACRFRRFRSSQVKPATLLKKRLWRGCFPVNFAKFLTTPFYRIPPNVSEDLF